MTRVTGLLSHWSRWAATQYCPARQCGCNVLRFLAGQIPGLRLRIRFNDRLYCSTACFERAAYIRYTEIYNRPSTTPPAPHRIPLGLLMLSHGQITAEQLGTALELQASRGQKKIGQWLQALNLVSEQQVTAILGQQWACPIYSQVRPNCCAAARMVPYPLLEHFRMYPIRYVAATRTLYMSFSERVEYGALHALEQMLDCRTEAGMVPSSQMDEFLDQTGRDRGLGDILFESYCGPSDMARITRDYVSRFGAEQVRIVSCGDYVWTRLWAGKENLSILVRRPAETPQREYLANRTIAAVAGAR